MDKKTLDCWTGHEHLYIVDNSSGFDEKMRRAMERIFKLIGVRPRRCGACDGATARDGPWGAMTVPRVHLSPCRHRLFVDASPSSRRRGAWRLDAPRHTAPRHTARRCRRRSR